MMPFWEGFTVLSTVSEAVTTRLECDCVALLLSHRLGDGVRYTRALFSLAAKLSPCVIFIDEVDALLGACVASVAVASVFALVMGETTNCCSSCKAGSFSRACVHILGDTFHLAAYMKRTKLYKVRTIASVRSTA